jgi:glycine/D-amino acid oxidase-like deaminating enzyme/nitrite reductase/ring-hydroxylating ferredoxin subunit
LESAGDQPHYPLLEQSLEIDVAIIGGGITGLTAALHLKNAGRRVAVLEGNEIGGGTTGFTTAECDVTTDQPLQQLINRFGEAATAAVVHASRDALDEIESRCNEFGDCDFARVPSYDYTEAATRPSWMREQYEAGCRLGLQLSLTDAIPLPFYCTHAVRTERQGRFHSERYLQHLARLVHGDGSYVFEHTRAQPPETGKPVITDGGEVRAKAVFVATHSAFLKVSQWDLRVAPYTSYVLGVRVDDEVPDALFWDDAEPYHYTRLADSRDPHLLLVGGADHKTGQDDDERDNFHQLEQYVGERYRVQALEYRWSAEFFEPVDGLPYVGRVPGSDDLFLATGFSGTGMTLGPVAGSLVADLILDRPNPLAKVLHPGRLDVMASAGSFVSENLNAAYKFVADRFAGPRVDSLDELAPGTGQLVTYQGKQLAVYRDTSGKVHALEPQCTHAGCIVHWNQAESTWDCPCHGGRYTAQGRCFYGPPPKDLGEAKIGPPQKQDTLDHQPITRV